MSVRLCEVCEIQIIVVPLNPRREGDLSGMLVSWPSAAASLPREQRCFDASLTSNLCNDWRWTEGRLLPH